jgi:hypothetical protein
MVPVLGGCTEVLKAYQLFSISLETEFEGYAFPMRAIEQFLKDTQTRLDLMKKQELVTFQRLRLIKELDMTQKQVSKERMPAVR